MDLFSLFVSILYDYPSWLIMFGVVKAAAGSLSRYARPLLVLFSTPATPIWQIFTASAFFTGVALAASFLPLPYPEATSAPYPAYPATSAKVGEHAYSSRSWRPILIYPPAVIHKGKHFSSAPEQNDARAEVSSNPMLME